MSKKVVLPDVVGHPESASVSDVHYHYQLEPGPIDSLYKRILGLTVTSHQQEGPKER